MGIEAYLLSSCVIGIMAQRLVRKICPACKTSYTPTESELNNLKITRKDLPGGVLYKGMGCASCLHSGYLGRHGIYELMPITSNVRKQILKSPEASQLQQVASLDGMTTLRDSSRLLALQGITSTEEVWRVTRADEEAV